jgi:hypothetical protein
MNYKAQQTCNAIITVISTLKHQHLTPDEISAAHLHMADLLTAADALEIPWKLQNSLLYIGELYDVRDRYLDQLFTMACARIGIDKGV